MGRGSLHPSWSLGHEARHSRHHVGQVRSTPGDQPNQLAHQSLTRLNLLRRDPDLCLWLAALLAHGDHRLASDIVPINGLLDVVHLVQGDPLLRRRDVHPAEPYRLLAEPALFR